MTFVALLRGINVGGRNITKMAALKACLEGAGLDRVETLIQSGNVVFETRQKSNAKLTAHIDAAIETALGIDPRVVVLSRDRLETVLDEAPAAWRSRAGLRTNIGSLATPQLWLCCALVLLVAIAGKFGGAALSAAAIGFSWREAVSIGLLMNTRGLMEMVVVNVGLEIGVVSPSLYTMIVIMALATTAMTTPLLRWSLKPTPPLADSSAVLS